MSPVPKPRSDRRAGALDALRFFAAAFIVLYHFGPNAPVDLASTAGIFSRGWLATDFFLVLSGYILGRAYGEALDEGRLRFSAFFARRISRVWPAQLIMLASLAALVVLAGLIGAAPGSPERFQWGDFFAQAALIHAWGVTHQAGWNEPSWTLSALIVCYAAFPLLWMASRPLAGRISALVAGLGLLTTAAALSITLLDHSLFDLPFHQGVMRALPLFAFGTLLARFAGGQALGRAASAATSVTAASTLAVIQAAPVSDLSAWLSVVAIAAIVISAEGLRIRSRPWLKWAADMSFALFITHALVGAAWFGLEEQLGLTASWPAWAGGVLAALIFASLFHRFVDEPIQERIRAVLTRPRTLAAPDGRLA